jgi:hypothetical protein
MIVSIPLCLTRSLGFVLIRMGLHLSLVLLSRLNLPMPHDRRIDDCAKVQDVARCHYPWPWRIRSSVPLQCV